MDSSAFRTAFKMSIPTLLVYFPLGMVLGIVYVHNGYDWTYPTLMSILVYAGAVQFLTLSMMTEHASVLAILLTALFVAMRNSFYGLSLLKRFNAHWLLKSFLIFGLVDATYAVLMKHTHPKDDLKFCAYTTLLIYVYWVAGTLVGSIFAKHLPAVHGLDFILTCFFMTIVIDYYRVHRSLKPLLLPLLASAMAYAILPQYYLLIAIGFSVTYLYACQKAVNNDKL